MGIKLLGFDLDGTLAESKSPIPPEIAKMLTDLLTRYKIAIISGGKFEQLKTQVADRIQSPFIHRLQLMPTCGTRFYKFDNTLGEWVLTYHNDLPDYTVDKITQVIADVAFSMGITPTELKTWGPQIENRGSQVTFSALGQNAPVEAKREWDVDGSIKAKMRDLISYKLPTTLSVRVGGATSIDITLAGMDKRYGMTQLMDFTGIHLTEILYFGDKLQPGGNDYPILDMGVECVEVSCWEDTLKYVKENL
jgi:HAD superfamily hydrolase (TIGR01484 family)